MRNIIMASAAVVALGCGSASAQESGGIVQDATNAVTSMVASVTPANQGTTVAIGVLAGYMLVSAPITVPAVIGAAAGGAIGYYWYGWYYGS